MTTNDRRGFTLTELIIVTVLGALVVAASMQILITNQRTYTAQNAKIQGQQATRAGADILFGELREISAQGGDILAMSSDSLALRVMRNFGVTCSVDLSLGVPILDVLKVGDHFEVGDSVFVFADNEERTADDDTWITGYVAVVDTTETCGSDEATELTFTGQTSLFTTDSVRTGAPVRTFTRYTYGLFSYNGETYLGRRAPGGDALPMVGPLRADDGVEFTYLDADGNVTSDEEDVRQIIVTLRTASEVMNSLGQMVSDSISGRIYTRN